MFITSLINIMNHTPTFIMFGILFILCMTLIVLFTRIFGKEGLYIYSVVALIASNIQVLKAVNIDGFDFPVPLGDVVFTSLFLAGDILTECWGRPAAQKGIWLGFASSLMFSIIMLMVVGMQPASESVNTDPFFIKAHESMAVLFTPSFSILAASLIAYFVSLWFDVGIFYIMKITFKDKYLWLRSFVSSSIGVIIDTMVFSIFAWVIFSVSSLSLDTVINTYMINAVKIRILLTIFSIPVFYLIKRIVANNSSSTVKSA
jgi:uncharacterized integral membrane protein (TIGR00697 family)